MNRPAPHRYRVSFGKNEAMRFTGHLDLLRAWERMVRRAGIPLAYTQGFSPHPRIQLGCALPLGCTSEAELAELWLDPPGEVGEIQGALRRAAPPGIEVFEVHPIDSGAPSLQSLIAAAEYAIELPTGIAFSDLEPRVRDLLARSTLPRERRGKCYDLRPLIDSLELTSLLGNGMNLCAVLAAREGATGRPEEVLLELGIKPAECRIHRRRLVLAEAKTHPNH